MKFNRFTTLLRGSFLLSGMLLSLSTQAGVISPSGFGFLDLGQSTVDQSSGLEWLDLTATRGRSLQNVLDDLNDAGGTFREQDRWQVATKLDFRNLMSNWFGLNYQGYHYDTPVSTVSLIHLLGDTADAELDALNSWADIADNAAGYTSGMLADEFDYFGVSTHRAMAIIVDYHLVYRQSREFGIDYVDYIDDFSWGDLNVGNDRNGVYLYRNYQPATQDVAAPTPLLLSALGLGLLGWQRRQQRQLNQ